MKKTFTKAAIIAAMSLVAVPAISAQKIEGWGDFKIYLDPGHSGHENQGIWGYSEAEKTLNIALTIQEMFLKYTDMNPDLIKLCRYDESTTVGLEERTDEANAWGADFYYSIHSDAGSNVNTILLLFGGWRKDGVEIEKTPNGGKAYGDILDPNLSGVMRVGSRGNWYDRCWYYRYDETHENQFPYLSVNRRSNMPSLLSEGGFHTMAEQQQNNMNAEYKRLEAFAAFQSLMKYHGMELPTQTWLAGVVTNSENNQPINGATISVAGLSYTTDTYESLFHKYTKNPNLIHNGFYLFEEVLEAGQTYDVVYSAPGFETVTKQVTILGGGENSADYVTFVDVALTSASPAKVDAVSASDLNNVGVVYPLTLTFSRNMNRQSVEDAFSINQGGEVTLSWQNDYTLDIDVSQLLPLWDYTIKIDGSIARNSQTNQLLDGDGDGVEGGDYILEFTMAEPDVEAPYIAVSYPADGSDVVYTSRPPITIELNEIVLWNDDDDHENLVTLKDADGKSYKGKLTHTVISEASVLTFIAEEPLPTDKAMIVEVAGGLKDMSGNVMEDASFRFLTEYRAMQSDAVIEAMTGAGTFWNPQGSGSSKGWIDEACATSAANNSPYYDGTQSMCVDYGFDETDAGEYWYLRIYDKNGNTTQQVAGGSLKGILSMWVYGDGSNNNIGVLLRDSSSNGLFHRTELMPVSFRGWHQWVWDMANDEWAETLTNNNVNLKRYWYFDAVEWKHEYTDPDDEEVAQSAWFGQFLCNDLRYTTWDDAAERQAKLDDVKPTVAVEKVKDADMRVTLHNGIVTVIAPETVKAVKVYDLTGKLVAKHRGGASVVTLSLNALTSGVYVVEAETANATTTAKVVK